MNTGPLDLCLLFKAMRESSYNEYQLVLTSAFKEKYSYFYIESLNEE